MSQPMPTQNHEPALIATIEREHRLALQAMGSAIKHVILAGDALIAAKSQVPRGQWLLWVEQNLTISPWSATDYMRLARHQDRLAGRNPHSIADALAMLVGEPRADGAPVDGGHLAAAEIENIKALAADGMGYVTIARTLGLTKATARRHCDDKYAERQRQQRKKYTKEGSRARKRLAVIENARAVGGGVDEAYSLLRRCLVQLDKAADAANGAAAVELRTAITRAHSAEDHIGYALRLMRSTDGR